MQAQAFTANMLVYKNEKFCNFGQKANVSVYVSCYGCHPHADKTQPDEILANKAYK